MFSHFFWSKQRHLTTLGANRGKQARHLSSHASEWLGLLCCASQKTVSFRVDCFTLGTRTPIAFVLSTVCFWMGICAPLWSKDCGTQGCKYSPLDRFHFVFSFPFHCFRCLFGRVTTMVWLVAACLWLIALHVKARGDSSCPQTMATSTENGDLTSVPMKNMSLRPTSCSRLLTGSRGAIREVGGVLAGRRSLRCQIVDIARACYIAEMSSSLAATRHATGAGIACPSCPFGGEAVFLQ